MWVLLWTTRITLTPRLSCAMSPVDGVTLEEAAHIDGCSRRTLVRHIDAGRLPGRVQVGRVAWAFLHPPF